LNSVQFSSVQADFWLHFQTAMNPKGKYSQSSRDDDDSCADERVFASIGD
jgi:hypothetical protein